MAWMEEACRVGDLGRVKELLQADPAVVYRPPGRCGLTWASYCGHEPVVRFLLAHGAEPNYLDPGTGGSAFHAVCCTGHMEVFKVLLQKGADPAKPTALGTSPLILAARSGHAEVVCALLCIPGISVNQVDTEGYSALWWGVYFGHANVVRLLIKCRADWRRTKEGGKTPIELARFRRNAGCLRLLMSAERAERREAKRVYLLAKARQIYEDSIDMSMLQHHDHHNKPRPSSLPMEAQEKKLSYYSFGTTAVAAAAGVDLVPKHLGRRVYEGSPMPEIELAHHATSRWVRWKDMLFHHLPRCTQPPTAERRRRRGGAVKDKAGGGVNGAEGGAKGLASKVVEEVISGGMKEDVFYDLLGYISNVNDEVMTA